MTLADRKLETMPAGAPVRLLGVDRDGLPVLTPQPDMGGLSVIGRHMILAPSANSADGDQGTFRKLYKAKGDFSQVRLMFANEGAASTVGGANTEQNFLNQVDVRGGIEFPLGQSSSIVGCNGRTTMTMDVDTPGFETEPVGFVLPDQSDFAARTFVKSTSGSAKFRYNTWLTKTGDSGNSTGISAGAGTDLVSSTGILSPNQGPGFKFGYTPTLVIGRGDKRYSLLMEGDSIPAGSGYNPSAELPRQTTNWFDRAFSDGELNSINAALSGAACYDMISPYANGSVRLRQRMWAYVGAILDQAGINDIGVAAAKTWQQLASYKLTKGRMATAMGIRYFVTTLTPFVTTTDGCITIANQTPASINQRRIDFNTWVRNGSQVDGSGNPVQSGGTASEYIEGYFDAAAAVEVNASNVLTENGGYIQVPTAAAYGPFTLTGTPTTTALAVSGTPLPLGLLPGMVVKMLTGARAGQTAVVSSNTTSAIVLYAAGDTAQSGIALSGLSGAPSAGDTFEVWAALSNEGLHFAPAGNSPIGTAFSTWLTTVGLK